MRASSGVKDWMEGRTTEARWGRTGSRAEMGKARKKKKIGHTIVDAGTGEGQSLVAGRGGNW